MKRKQKISKEELKNSIIIQFPPARPVGIRERPPGPGGDLIEDKNHEKK